MAIQTKEELLNTIRKIATVHKVNRLTVCRMIIDNTECSLAAECNRWICATERIAMVLIEHPAAHVSIVCETDTMLRLRVGGRGQKYSIMEGFSK